MDSQDIIANIEGQIENCLKLLSIFQDERKAYQEGCELSHSQMLEMLARKGKLVEVFERQREIMKAIESAGKDKIPEETSERRKQLMRRLGSILEQLLVIDQENERLMRSAACSSKRPAFDSAVTARQRPGLQRQLPFMPFAPSSPARETAIPQRAQRSEGGALPSVAMAVSRRQEREAPVKIPAGQGAVSAAKFPSISSGEAAPLRPRSHLRGYASSAGGGSLAGSRYV